MRIAILTDNGAGFTDEEIKNLGIHLVSLRFFIDDVELLGNIPDDLFFDNISKAKSIKTSQPSVDDFEKSFDTLLNYYDIVLYFPTSSSLSGAHNTALILAEADKYKDRVFSIDTKTVSVLQKFAVLDALKLISAGKSVKDINNVFADNQKYNSIYLAVDTLEYLKRGGRIGSVAASLGTLLNIKPILYSNGGNFDVIKKVRSFQQAKETMISFIKNDIENKLKGFSYSIGIAYSKCESEAQLLKESVLLEFPYISREIPVDPLAKFISCHTGPNVLGLAVYKNIDEY